MFIESADESYLASRFCWFSGLMAPFFWNALHAIEKYLKASLLVNGRSAISHAGDSKKYGHDISRLYAAVAQYASDCMPDDLIKPEDFPANNWLNQSVSQYVDRLNQVGDPNNRYNVFGHVQLADDLYKVDQLAFISRSIAVPLDYTAFIGPVDENHKSNRELLKNDIHRRRTPSDRRWRQILHYSNRPLPTNILSEQNLPFFPEVEKIGVVGPIFSGTNSPLYVNILSEREKLNGTPDPLRAELCQWVIENVPLPKELRHQISEAQTAFRNGE